MQRRDFLQVMTATGLVLVPGVLEGCGRAMPGYSGWRGPDPREKDVRRVALSYGLLAPNPHNKQPWIVRYDGSRGFFLYVDETRLLPETDPPSRQIHIGHGTFLENAVLAASHLAHRAEVDYFPAGSYSNTRLESKPVARVEFVPDPTVREDPLFAVILARESNKRPYDGTPLVDAEIAGLRGAYDMRDYPLSLTTDPALRKKLGNLLTRAMAVESQSVARDIETISMFRFDDDEMNRYRDGFGLPQAGVTGLRRWFAETFAVSRKAAEADPLAFGRRAIDLTRDQAESAAAFGWITSPTNERLDQVKVGRAYARVNLTATALGVALHPMSQILQEYGDMASLQAELKESLRIAPGHTVQMLFRLGHAEAVEHAPRRGVDDIVRG